MPRRIERRGLSRRRAASLLRVAAAPFAGLVVGLSVGGAFGALAGAVLGSLLGELARRSGLFGSPAAYLRDPLSRPGGPPFDEPFPGACALAGFVISFDPENLFPTGPRREVRADFERVALARIVLERDASLSVRQRRGFARLAQGLLPLAPTLPPEADLRAYFSLPDADPLLGALCAWTLFKAGRPEPDREALEALRVFLEEAACPAEAAAAAEADCFPERLEDWELLGLEPGASREEIKRNFRSLSLAFHPDGFGDAEPVQRKEAEEAFRRVRAAYERLTRER